MFIVAHADPVEGSGGRVILAQLFREFGEDEFMRGITVWLVDAARDKVNR